jgi:diguanylate cyclase (GGDEF)-like protein/PAS domain S-box-containing protein
MFDDEGDSLTNRRWELSEFESLCMRNLLDNSEERIYFKDRDGRFLLVSKHCIERMVPGASARDIVGKTDFDFFDERSAREFYDGEQRIMQTGEADVGIIEAEHWQDGTVSWVSTTKLPLRDEAGAIIGTYGISRDISRQVEAERLLAHQALHDPLTNLTNRVALMDRLSQALVALERNRGKVALFFMDLDKFKTINDTLGHDVGDTVLIEVGRRLSSVARRLDTVARLGGDEFVVLCRGLKDVDDHRLLADRFRRAVDRPLPVAGHDVNITISIGVAVSSDPEADGAQLLQDADVAMYRAKELGGNRFQLFTPSQRSRVLADYALEADLRQALEFSELFVLYQPLFALEDRTLRGVEALVRWRHPERGVLLPAEFVPMAEQRGLVNRIDTFVLEEACRQLASWRTETAWPADFSVAVNVSGRQLSDPGFPARVASAVSRHGIDPRWLCLEITETSLIGEAGEIDGVLTELSAVGVQLALDDFGTGYSTLAHLQQLKVDVLKIDRSFVERIDHSERDREIVAAVTAMSHALGMAVIGEGIETDRQYDDLAALDCDVGQGFLLARPLTPDRVAELVHPRTGWPTLPTSAGNDHRAAAQSAGAAR